MATATTSYPNDTCPRVTFTITEKSSTGNKQTYSWTLKYVTKGYTISGATTKRVTASIAGSYVYDESITVSGKTSYTIASGTKTVNKSHSADTLSCSVSIYWDGVVWSGTNLGTRKGSTTVDLDKQTSYKISYNANGGSGAPSTQTKWYGDTLTLSSTKPTRSGWTFVGWGSSATDTSKDADPGGSYTSNSAHTYYAIWSKSVSLKYDANGGSGAPSTNTGTVYNGNSRSVTISATVPTRTNYKFLGWSEVKTATEQNSSYNAGKTVNLSSSLTIYAIWKLDYIAPKITNFSCYRCDESGNMSDDGTFARVVFDWTIDTTADPSNVLKKASIKINNVEVWSDTSSGGTSGQVSRLFSGIDTDAVYNIAALVSDTWVSGKTTSVTGTIETAMYTMDFLADKDGFAIGKTAELENTLDVNWNIYARKGIQVYGDSNTTGKVKAGSIESTGALKASSVTIGGHNSAIGSDIDAYGSISVSLPASSWTTAHSIALPAGVWIVFAMVRLAKSDSADAANVGVCISDNPNSNNVTRTERIRVASSDQDIYLNTCALLTPSETTTYYATAYSSKARSIDYYRLTAVRIR